MAGSLGREKLWNRKWQSTVAWEILWTEEPSRLHTVHWGHKRVGHDLPTKQL